ncbi:FHA domain-containing protein [Pseudonocardia acaciae]|uniref:FHA domain-containing protein n=1 Tax=Pseudonocardia acaciae TaxID=551276 RepID=UPI0005666FFB|nr:FHA domain-containing protein [Pseudonocardia acaciae]
MTSVPSRSTSTSARLLPPDTGSLARGVPRCTPGTLFALARRGGIQVDPAARFDVLFGRNEPEVHVPVGEDDPRVSRRHGVLRCDGRRWTIRNIGVVPIRLPGSQLLLSGHEQPLPVSYTPVFIRTEPGREHLLELRVASATSDGMWARHDDATGRPATWALSARERLVLVALGQRYLRHEAHPQPQSWNQVAEELAELQPDQRWTPKIAEHTVREVRSRLAGTVAGLTRDEVGEPVGNALNHNLLAELLVTTTLVPPDLSLLDPSSETR